MQTLQQLSRQAFDQFKAQYKVEFGVLLSDAEVQEVAVRLLRFFEMLAKTNLTEGHKETST